MSNEEVDLGKHRFPNMTLPPFSWPPPLRVIDEVPVMSDGRPDKQLALWRVEDLPN